jgi:hypothetical protein
LQNERGLHVAVADHDLPGVDGGQDLVFDVCVSVGRDGERERLPGQAGLAGAHQSAEWGVGGFSREVGRDPPTLKQ